MAEIEINGITYRAKKMSGVEILAIRENWSLDTIEDSIKTFDACLERIEANCDGEWIPCKLKSTYYPATLKDDVILIKKLVNFFMNELMAVFTKSAG